MPKYIVSSEGPISVREFHRPDFPDLPERPTDPGWGVDEGDLGPGKPKPPWAEWRPPDITLPPREEWPPLPPIPELPPDWKDQLKDYLGSLSPEQPWIPVPGGPEVEPPPVWPPVNLPSLPDFSGKTLVLARIYVSRRVNYLRWVVIDHQKVKDKIQAIKDHIKDRLPHPPAGGIGGTPPQRPQPGAPR